VPEPTVAQRIVRAKRTLAEARVPFEVPVPPNSARLASVLEVIYLIFNEGYAATAGRRLDAPGAVRGGAAPGPHPRRTGARGARGARPGGADGDPGLALRARVGPQGEPILLLEQDRGAGIAC
jgi:RNA polymerase sigma-70 factor, ECF subfamily